MLVLKEGARGPEVKRLQHLLNSRVSPSVNLPVDGKFGPNTTAAVRRFQALNHLAGDGIAGPQVWQALGQRGSTRTTLDALVNQCSPDARWLEIAALEFGVHEDSRPGHHQQRIVAYHQTTSLKAQTDEVAWCSSFVNWVMREARYEGTNSALAKSWLASARGLDHPRQGAITVIKKKGATSDVETGSTTGYHVAFFIEGSSTQLRLLGGNQSDQVKYSNYSLTSWDVKGFRWP